MHFTFLVSNVLENCFVNILGKNGINVINISLSMFFNCKNIVLLVVKLSTIYKFRFNKTFFLYVCVKLTYLAVSDQVELNRFTIVSRDVPSKFKVIRIRTGHFLSVSQIYIDR